MMRTITPGLILSVLLLAAGCSSAARQNSPVAQQATQGTGQQSVQQSSQQASVNSATQAAADSAATAPDALVAELYRRSDKHQGPFFQTRDRALVDKYFDRELADLIWKDAVDSKGEVGALEADPLYDAQDVEIKNFSVHAPVLKDGRAEVPVSFENFGKKQSVLFLLASGDGGWKITDIKYKDGRTLSGMLKGSGGGQAARP